MIHFKVNKYTFNENNLDAMRKEFPLIPSRAIHRVITRCLNNELKEFPEIDVVVNFKWNKTILGRFYPHRLFKGKEYNFLGDNSQPCIVLFMTTISDAYIWHKVKGIRYVLVHEFEHLRQWLNNEKLRHHRNLKAKVKMF